MEQKREKVEIVPKNWFFLQSLFEFPRIKLSQSDNIISDV